MPHQVHQVGRILTVVNRERGIETDPIGVLAKQAGANAVERAGPIQGLVHDARPVAEHLARDSLDPLRHFGCGAPGERHQQDSAWIGTADDQTRDAVGKRVRLARAGAGDDQQRNADVKHPKSHPNRSA